MHVWLARTRDCGSPELLAYYRSLLSRDEDLRYRRLAFEHLRCEYLLTRALCRTALSRYTAIDARDLQFYTNRYGRPELASHKSAAIRFNLSNSSGLVICAVSLNIDIGVDVEQIETLGDATSIARSVFSAEEQQALLALPESRQPERFFELWTLKESYVKARGMGLTIDPRNISFDLDCDPIRVEFDSQLRDMPLHWQFERYRAGDEHVVSVAIRRQALPTFKVLFQEVIPRDVQP